jgi:hypothetical protein
MKVNKTLIIEIIAALFILLFVYTAVTKLMNRERFSAVLSQLPLVGTASTILSYLLPIVELTIVLFLFIPSLRVWGFAGSLLLMLIFTFYIIYMIFFTQHLPCSCGGVLEKMTWMQHLLFNIFFTSLASIGLRFSLRNKLFIAINRQS